VEGEKKLYAVGNGPLLPSFTVKRFFSFTATFKSEKEHPKCDCNCCTFRQFVLESEMVYTRDDSYSPGSGWLVEYDPIESDIDGCQWVRRIGADDFEHANLPAGEGPPSGEGWEGPFCYGDHKKNPSDKYIGYSENGCKYMGWDTPTQPTFVNSRWDWYWLSLGLIVDRCHNYAIKRAKFLAWHVSGITTERGAMVTSIDGKPIVR